MDTEATQYQRPTSQTLSFESVDSRTVHDKKARYFRALTVFLGFVPHQLSRFLQNVQGKIVKPADWTEDDIIIAYVPLFAFKLLF